MTTKKAKKLSVYCPDLELQFMVSSLNELGVVSGNWYSEDQLDLEGDLCIFDENEYNELAAVVLSSERGL